MLKRSCHFYNTTGKCHFGKHCKFVHDLSTPSQQPAVESNKYEAVNSQEATPVAEEVSENFQEPTDSTSKDEAVNSQEKLRGKVCRNYEKNRFCRYGNRCRFQHIIPAKKADDVRDSRDVPAVQNEGTTSSAPDQVQNEERIEPEKADVKQNLAKSGLKSGSRKRICRFFKQGNCKYGEHCAFYHPAAPSIGKATSENDAPTSGVNQSNLENAKTDVQQKKEEDTKQSSGWRQVSRPPKIMNVFKRDEIIKEKQAELRETEIKQLKRRFPTDKLKIISDSEENATFIFTFFPTDPDWPFDVKTFEIRVEFGPGYPLKLFSISLPLDQDLPSTVRRYIEVSLQEWVAKKEEDCVKKNIVELLFRPFLRWMDKNMETIVTEGLKQLRRELTANAAGLQFISAKELCKEPDQQTSHEPDDFPEVVSEKDSRRPVAYRKNDHVDETYEVPVHEHHTSDDDGDDGDDDENGTDSGEGEPEGAEDKVHQRPKIDPDTERRGTEMSFRNMQIWYCTTIMMEKLRLVVRCERCKNTTDFSTPPNRVNSLVCSKCSNTQLVVFRPVLTHAYSSTFGYLDLDGCMAQDVILQDCHFSLGCVMCSRDILVKSFSAGRVMEIYCRGCHSKMKFAADSVKMTVLTTEGVDSSKFSGKIHSVKVRKNQRLLKDPAIQEGKPLPNNGACKHYKKSFRWLRFPCCGKTYPCDLCHDDKEDHEMKFANRMICGFCCKEQPFAAEKPCSACSSALTKVRTTHWEGGRGCRDKISMSRTDDKKYTNLHKTVSNKAKAAQEKNKSKKNTKLRHT